MRRVYKNLCPATVSASIMAANIWKNSLKNAESDNNKILYEILLDFFLQRNGTYFLNKPRSFGVQISQGKKLMFATQRKCYGIKISCFKYKLYYLNIKSKLHIKSFYHSSQTNVSAKSRLRKNSHWIRSPEKTVIPNYLGLVIHLLQPDLQKIHVPQIR